VSGADESGADESGVDERGVVAGLGGASGVMAVGTMASRLTGVLRDTALGAALGTAVLADTYTVANTIPNTIYALLAGGAITAVFVPQLVRHLKEDEDGGTVYTQRLLTLATLLLLAVSVLAVVFAPWIVRLYATSDWSADDFAVSTAFARYCLPEILFYGLFTMFQQVLNARGKFAAPMFAPILNNVVVIATCGLFAVVVGGNALTTSTITDGQIALLGLGTLVGIAVQALVLVPVMRRAGFRWRPRFDFRNAGLGRVGTLASWTFVYVATNQLVFLVIARLATSANTLDGTGDADVGLTSYLRAFLVFVLPHSVITLSVVTALMPRMAGHAIGGRLRQVADDLTGGLRLSLVGIVPATAALVVLAPLVAVVLFGYGATDIADARAIGSVTQLFVLGLVPYTVFFVLVRGYYALEDTRTPALVNLLLNALNVAGALLLFSLAPDDLKVQALAAAYLPAYTVAAVVMWVLLSRRLGGLEVFTTVQALVRLIVAAVPAGLLMLLVSWAATTALGSGRLGSLVGILVALPLGAGLFLLVARRLRVEEISELGALVRSRLGR
jgi:putative peptidoglycan lipid II flippase